MVQGVFLGEGALAIGIALEPVGARQGLDFPSHQAHGDLQEIGGAIAAAIIHQHVLDPIGGVPLTPQPCQQLRQVCFAVVDRDDDRHRGILLRLRLLGCHRGCHGSYRHGPNSKLVPVSPLRGLLFRRPILISVKIIMNETNVGITLMGLDRITSHPKRMNGQPCIRNLRLTVRRVIELLATYPDRGELCQEFPELEDEDIRQALIFASSYLDDRIIELPNRYETVA